MMAKAQNSVTLREYVDTRFADIEKNIQFGRKADAQRFEDVKERTALAAAANGARLEHMNEWRTEYDSQRADFPTRLEVTGMITTLQSTEDANEKRIQVLEKSSANVEGRLWAVGIAFTVISALISIGLHFVK